MLKKLLINKSFHTFFFILVLILIASVFRFYNINWDQSHFFHPDERNIDNAVSRISFFSQLNPMFFAYGGFSIYLYRVGAEIMSLITSNASWLSDWEHINSIGRFFSAFFSTLTIVPIYFLTKKISDKKTALLAVTFYTFSVTSIQTAHYGVTESLIALIGVSICLFSVTLYKKITFKNAIALAMVLGIGIAAKTTAISFIIMPLIAYFFILVKRQSKFLRLFFNFLIFICISFFIFALFSPYTFLDHEKFMESMRYESGVVSGSLPVVYTFQFINTIPYVFAIQNFFWQIGLNTVFCILGFIYVLFTTVKNKKIELLIFVTFPLLYFLYVGAWHTKFLRYMVPIIPFLLISSSIFLLRIKEKFKITGSFIISFILISTIAWALAFFSIYLRPQTRIEASKWIYYNVPHQNKILNEQWDDGLPVPLDGFTPNQYRITSLAMYDSDNQDKINYLASNLSDANYIVFNSRRLYGTLINLEDKYPITSRYYKLLFAEQLGYKKVAEFTSYPSILGITINDDKSEETFQVYDHPKVIIFKNENRFSEEKLNSLLSDYAM